MLEWNELHPYNAVHVARIPGAVDPDRLTDVVNATLEAHGLTNLTLNRSHGTFDYAGGPTNSEFKVLAASEDPRSTLAVEIERQLNTAFQIEGRFNPFRFVIAPGVDSFSFAIAYLHAIADAESIVRLLRNMLDAYLEGGASSCSQRVEFQTGCRKTPPYRPVQLARLLTSMFALLGNVRSSCRPRYRDVHNFTNGYSSVSLSPESLHSLLKTARTLGATLNDLFLALLMKSLSPLAADRAKARRRRKIALGSIVNVRKDLGVDGVRSFGLLLGSFLVAHEVPDQITLPDLVRHIRRETLRIKERRLYLANRLQLAIGLPVFRLFSEESRRKFYQRYYPLWGGITNMNLNSLWEQRSDRVPVDYFRAVSTGPATPLVLSVTTAGDVLNIGLSFRTTVFSAPDIERVKGFLVDWEKQFQV